MDDIPLSRGLKRFSEGQVTYIVEGGELLN
jgi:hypothetical protein